MGTANRYAMADLGLAVLTRKRRIHEPRSLRAFLRLLFSIGARFIVQQEKRNTNDMPPENGDRWTLLLKTDGEKCHNQLNKEERELGEADEGGAPVGIPRT
jgi:hypothetical protein